MKKLEKNADAQVLRLLARREHSQTELRKKLLQREYSLEETNAAIQKAEIKKWQSDTRFIEQYIRRRVMAGMGSVRIAAELCEHRLPKSAIQKALYEGDFSEPFWREHLETVWKKKFSTTPKDKNEYAKQARFLLQRGFEQGDVRHLLQRL